MAESSPRRRSAARSNGNEADLAEGSSVDDHLNHEISRNSNTPLEKEQRKSLFSAYLHYLFFGWCSGHLFYLGRDFHTFVSVTTFGRFGLGILMDTCFLPQYVAEANENLETQYVWRKRAKQGYSRCPLLACSVECFSRAVLLYLTATLYLSMANHCVPLDLEHIDVIMAVLEALGVGSAVWLVGNIGVTEIAAVPVFGTSLVASFVLLFTGMAENDQLLSLVAVTIGLVLGRYRKPLDRFTARRASKSSACKRFTVLLLGLSIYGAVMGGVLLFNAEVTNEEGQQIKLFDALKNFYNSPAWDQTWESFGKIYEEATREETEYDRENHDRWERFFSKFKDVFDVDGQQRALLELGLSENATDAEIKAAYRKMAKLYHPDRNRDANASEKFMKLQEAYETLQRVRDLRKK
ncbi:dnaJ homolog subfamily C member 22-like [Sycon ciliatum]|uniref:dnaJ homolog subfamily C member 22-like n=1 Tax=Sycon ciliatum TaxID=27933 RepID=UPI0031F68587